jgi:hypothetical protein
MAKTQEGQNLRVVVFAEGNQWIAQALEHDICAQGPDLNTVQERLLDTIDAEVSMATAAGEVPFLSISPAPEHFFRMWDERSKFSAPVNLTGNNDGRVELALCA